MLHFFSELLDASRIEDVYSGVKMKVHRLCMMAVSLARCQNGFDIVGGNQLRLVISSAGMVSGLLQQIQFHHQSIEIAFSHQWNSMTEMTTSWPTSNDQEIQLQDVVMFSLCAKRCRKKQNKKPWENHTIKMLNDLRAAVILMLADSCHVMTWTYAADFLGKPVPLRQFALNRLHIDYKTMFVVS